MAMNLVKLPTGKSNLLLRVCKGHFVTGHSHINYYIDVTMTKCRLAEARAAAAELVRAYAHTTVVDTILCLDGTEALGAQRWIYIQLLFRENTAPMIAGKHVLVLAASVTTGYTAESAVEAINYYGGIPVGVAALFATRKECAGFPITSIFDPNDLPGYESHDAHDCPWCKAGQRIDALVNSFGYSSL